MAARRTGSRISRFTVAANLFTAPYTLAPRHRLLRCPLTGLSCAARIGWGLVFQGVRDFYHSKFIPAEPNFYHFNMVQSLQLLPAAYTYTPKICLRFARPDPMPDPHRVMLCTWAALLRMRVQSATANSHHHLTPRLPHTCPAAACTRPCPPWARPSHSQSAVAVASRYWLLLTARLGKPFSFTARTALISANRDFYRFKMCFVLTHFYHFKSKALNFYLTPTL